ncbi:hypothetical protein [Tenacibaculum maritimum]|uniref:hypothetical protein n=1 Tax=Tenacibaculum maritimum TaxID=107401 RepID=UPI0013307A55|nr:hypothetical protein [Tenacibaculum maritimum]
MIINMILKYLRNRSEIRKYETIERLEEQVSELEINLEKERFKYANYDLINKYISGFHVTPDVIISDVSIKDNKEVKSAIVLGKLFNLFSSNKKELKEIEQKAFYFEFECIDLKSKEKITLDLGEIKKLEEIK